MKTNIRCQLILLGTMIIFAESLAAESMHPTSSTSNIQTNSEESLTGWKISEQSISKIFPGRVSKFTVSPDGRHVAYLAYANGKPDQVSEEGDIGKIVVVLDGKKGAQSYDSDPFGIPIRSLIFSPDSKILAYLAYDGREVFVSGLDEEHFGSKKIKGKDGKDSEDFGKPEYAGIKKAYGLTFSPDSKSVAYVASSYAAKGPSYVVVNGKKGAAYPQIISSPVFSRDSKRLAFVVRSDRPYGDFVVVDGQEGKRYISVDTRYMTFSPDSKKFAYIAGSGDETGPNRHMEYFVITDGQEGKHYSGIGDYIKFSPDSQHIAYSAKFGERKWAMVVDGKEGMIHDAWNILVLNFNSDSKRVAYLVSPQLGVRGDEFVMEAGEKEERFKPVLLDYAYSDEDATHSAYRDVSGDISIVVKNKNGKFTPASPPVFSSEGLQVAYVVTNESKSFVVSFGKDGKRYDQITNLVFSPDGKYLVYTAHDKSINKWFVVVNGLEGKKYDFVMAKDAAEKENEVNQNIETGSLQFDAPDKIHYLAVDGKNLILVEMQL